MHVSDAVRCRDAPLQVALVLPLHGPAGLFGPSGEMCAALAAAEVNAAGGVLGRELRLHVVDGGAPPQRVADEVDALVSTGAVEAVTGWHISAVRQAVARRTTGRVPYVYTALYEGGERTPGVFLTGETPQHQLLPAIRWFAEELGVRRWCVVGDDYVWPRVTSMRVRAYAAATGGTVCGRCSSAWAAKTCGLPSAASRAARRTPSSCFWSARTPCASTGPSRPPGCTCGCPG